MGEVGGREEEGGWGRGRVEGGGKIHGTSVLQGVYTKDARECG